MNYIYTRTIETNSQRRDTKHYTHVLLTKRAQAFTNLGSEFGKMSGPYELETVFEAFSVVAKCFRKFSRSVWLNK